MLGDAMIRLCGRQRRDGAARGGRRGLRGDGGAASVAGAQLIWRVSGGAYGLGRLTENQSASSGLAGGFARAGRMMMPTIPRMVAAA
jgi:hypothetical protein